MYIANKFKNKYVQSVGMSSLIIMLVHEPIKRVIIKVMELLLNIEGEIFRKSIVFSLLITLIIILVSIIIEKIFNLSSVKCMNYFICNLLNKMSMKNMKNYHDNREDRERREGREGIESQIIKLVDELMIFRENIVAR